MKHNPAQAYRHHRVHSSSGVGLIIMLYETAISSLQKAHSALQAKDKDIEERTNSLNHVLEVIAELQSSLDPTQGDEVADNLNLFYNVARGLVNEANAGGSPKPVQQLLSLFRSMLGAWRKVDKSTSGPSEQQGTPGPLPAPSSPEPAPKSSSAGFESNYADTDPTTSRWSA